MKEVDQKTQALDVRPSVTEAVVRVFVVGGLLVWLLFFLFGCSAPESREPLPGFEALVTERFDARSAAWGAWQRGEGPAEFRDTELETLWQLEADAQELAQLEQPYSIKHTTDYQMGVDASDARMQCTRTNPLQNCSLLNTKSVLFYIEGADFGPPGTGYNDEIYTYVSQLDAALSSWTFTETFAPSTPNIVLVFRRGACTGGPSSTSIAAFSCMTLAASGQNLTENTGVSGNYTAHLGATAWIDMGDVTQRADTTIRRLRLVRHAAGHATLGAISLGGRTDSGASDFVSRMTVDVDWSGATISSGEDCRAEAYVPTQNGQVTRLQPSCGGAN